MNDFQCIAAMICHITSPETVDMTYDAPTDTWTGTLAASCVSTNTVTVTFGISGGGSASFTVP